MTEWRLDEPTPEVETEEVKDDSCGSCGADIGPSTSFPWHGPDEDCRAIREPKISDISNGEPGEAKLCSLRPGSRFRLHLRTGLDIPGVLLRVTAGSALVEIGAAGRSFTATNTDGEAQQVEIQGGTREEHWDYETYVFPEG